MVKTVQRLDSCLHSVLFTILHKISQQYLRLVSYIKDWDQKVVIPGFFLLSPGPVYIGFDVRSGDLCIIISCRGMCQKANTSENFKLSKIKQLSRMECKRFFTEEIENQTVAHHTTPEMNQRNLLF